MGISTYDAPFGFAPPSIYKYNIDIVLEILHGSLFWFSELSIFFPDSSIFWKDSSSLFQFLQNLMAVSNEVFFLVFLKWGIKCYIVYIVL